MARHKEFDQEVVLEKAMETFWRYGYEGTSIQALLQAMGINRGSLYDTFGDKRSLFQAAIAHYNQTVIRQALAALEAPEASKQAIVDHFSQLVETAIADPQHRGCFLTNSAVELGPHDPEMANCVSANLRRMEDAFYQALVRAQEKGEIAPGHQPRAIAKYLTCCLQGLRVVCRLNPEPETLRGVAQVALSVLN
jgi:TetR/AcrR family transcriptional repressor of nem operon